MFNVSTLLLDDALLKCVVTEVVLFSVLICIARGVTSSISDTLIVFVTTYLP